MRRLVENDPDFVSLPRFGYSLARVLEAHPEGCSDRVISQALMIPEAELPGLYASIVQKLRTSLKIN